MEGHTKSDPVVIYTVRDKVATVRMNRPDKRNALNLELVEGLRSALTRAVEDETVRVVVLEGAGSAFSAGADLAALEALQRATPLENLSDSSHLAGLFETIYLLPKPVIAKVHGHAIAGGCGLAAVCDFSIAAEGVKMGFTEVRIGFVPAIVMVFTLRKLAETVARDLMLRGHLITSERAAAVGLITRTVSPEALDETVAELAREIATRTSASAVALTKEMLAHVPGMGFREALSYARQMNAFARGTEDCKAGVEAFLNRTDPPWRSTST
jgi:methylglutaconyl-CoA hydratase